MLQPLDHFDPSNPNTLQQKFFVNATQFNPQSGPVLLMLGGEGPLSPTSVAGHFVLNQYAEQFQGLLVSLEHRFYGDSVPGGGADAPTPATVLTFLSSKQALADAAAFQAMLSAQLNLTAANRWIVFGGSYSGSLSAWAKLKYPDLFVGAISASAPVQV